jgi:hypothetical protein
MSARVNAGYLNRAREYRQFGNGRKNSKKHVLFHLYAEKNVSGLALKQMGKYS